MWHLWQGASERAARWIAGARGRRLSSSDRGIRGLGAAVPQADEEQDFDRQLRPRSRAATGQEDKRVPQWAARGHRSAGPASEEAGYLVGGVAFQCFTGDVVAAQGGLGAGVA